MVGAESQIEMPLIFPSVSAAFNNAEKPSAQIRKMAILVVLLGVQLAYVSFGRWKQTDFNQECTLVLSPF
jgi:hypothetical protein